MAAQLVAALPILGLLGHNLGLTVVAEGVEDRATLRALELLGCDVAQGFYFAQALDGPTFQSWVRNYTTADTVGPVDAIRTLHAIGPLEDLELEAR